jgi:tRNA (cmo5U34)-methyltransferase
MTDTAPHHEHDWLSASYVEQWIAGDARRHDERRPKLRRAASLLPFDRDLPLRVVDLGGGSGEFAAQVLEEFPNSTAVIHDFSAPMLMAARERLAEFRPRVDFQISDLRERGWSGSLSGPFDAVISAIAIHNLWDPAAIRAVYEEVFTIVSPGGVFLNLDYIFPRSALLSGLYARVTATPAGSSPSSRPRDGVDDATLESQLRWLREAGFAAVDCVNKDLSEVLLCALRESP